MNEERLFFSTDSQLNFGVIQATGSLDGIYGRICTCHSVYLRFCAEAHFNVERMDFCSMDGCASGVKYKQYEEE